MFRYKLKKHDFHLWLVDVNDTEVLLETLSSFLSNEELHKAEKFKFEKDRKVSIISRGVLRLLLSKYLNTNPSNIKFIYGQYGKPIVTNKENITFNVSHSSNKIIIGFTKGYDIGVDVELIKYNFDLVNIAENFFSKSEINLLSKFQPKDYPIGFYRCWTRKESFIKAKSKGLSFPLDSFSVSLDSDSNAEITETKWNNNERHEWFVHSLNLGKTYQVAAAIRGKITNIETIEFSKFNKYFL
ncbi:4'-phosphopantetheinyl transferase family protein [Hyunsoonleella ulvae]|uniref:4'-phosphopantetheinyl transferase family protein n=1 Tax=Hyunsoonleella ulvae TaxID=2799948 RepID=UPI00193ADC07|nr:4'-phosphopantetheinyl transferase superfamily protein [Hyunsoonleella ulvae]